jgi:thioredoxin-related protein
MKPSVIVFTGSNCAKCDSLKARLADRGFNPTTEEAEGHYAVKDVMSNMALAKQHGVRSVPTTVVVDEAGKQVGFFISDNKIDEIVEYLKQEA